MLKAINVGSGQRPYKSTAEVEWTNLDIQERWNPDMVDDWRELKLCPDESYDIIVAEQTVEHVGCGEAVPFFKKAHRVLKPGGSLVLTMPDLRALAQRWLLGQIDDYIYSVNLYGAYMGDEADRHKWNTSYEGWKKQLLEGAPWASIKRGKPDPNIPVSSDWWILHIEAVK